MDNITLLAKAFAEDVMNITADIMASSMLVNDKVGRNTISPNSDYSSKCMRRLAVI